MAKEADKKAIEPDEDIGGDMDVLLQAAELGRHLAVRFHVHVAAQAACRIRQGWPPYGSAGVTWRRGAVRRSKAREVLVQPQDLPQVLAFIKGETSSLSSGVSSAADSEAAM